MAFRKAVIEIKPAATGTGIKASLRRGKASAAKLMLGVKPEVARLLDWKHDDKLETLIGEGEHHGLIRLRKNNSVGQAVVSRRETAKGAWISISLGAQDAYVDRAEAARWCQWDKIEDGWVEVALPVWADETGPRKRAAPESARPAPIAAPRKAVSVTSSLMGDPEPGRREAVAKIGAR